MTDVDVTNAVSVGNPLLELKDLKTYFYTSSGVVRAVDNVTLNINHKESLGLVGESGCGKSTVAFSIMKLIPRPGKIVAGQILLEGEDLVNKDEEHMRKIRGSRIAMSFQDPMTYLNPVRTIGDQVAEAILLHQNVGKSQALEQAIRALELTQIPSAEEKARSYPHQLSGGMRQRALIAMALACQPGLLIADEPTTALDVLVQDEILDLMIELQQKLGTSILLITHDLGVVARVSDKVAVMYAGRIVEYSDTRSIYKEPQHPYTIGLIGSTPRLDVKSTRLRSIEGNVPSLVSPPPGCRFHPRCPYSKERCKRDEPRFVQIAAEHYVLCHKS